MKILIVKTGALGDVVRTTVLLSELKGEIHWLSREHAKELLRSPNISETYFMEDKDSINRLIKQEFDLIICLNEEIDDLNVVKQIKTKKLIGAFLNDNGEIDYTPESSYWFDMSRISKFGREKANELKKRNKKTLPEILLNMIGKEFKGQEYDIGFKNERKIRVGLIDVSIGVWPNKYWHGYHELAEKLVKEGYEVEFLKIKRSIREHIDDINRCDIAVCADTLGMHLALALKKKVVALFNCTPPQEIEGYNLMEKVVSPIIEKNLYKKGINTDSIFSISVKEVYDAIKKVSKPEEKLQEWSNKSKYNSFNSYKGLTWVDSHYKPIVKWFKGEGQLPPPIELSLDPGHLCNFGCPHCNAKRYLIIKPDEVPKDRKIMTKEHLKKIIDFMADWGVRGVCIGGGGEPLMNKNVWDLPSYIASKGMKCSYATNGSLINEQIANEMMNCRWVGVSVDAATRETFKKIHKVDCFDKVIENIRLLVRKKKETGSKIDISYKFLIGPNNWHEIYAACKLAKELGVRDFHARPVDLERKDFEQGIELNYNIEKIHELFKKCHELEEGDEFRVFTVMHKYNPEFKVCHNFKNCSSSALMIQVCSDGNVYVCADHRIEDRFKLGSHFPDLKEILRFWGSDKHRELLKSINVDAECGRCTYGEYARQIEELVAEIKEEDPMCVDFP